MRFFNGLFRMRDAPKNKTSGSSYSFFMGDSTSGKSVNERSSMQMTAVYSCVRILSEAVASLPLHFYEYGLLRGDYQSRMNGYATARQNGWMSANDIRELDRISAELGGDVYLINGNITLRLDALYDAIVELEEHIDDAKLRKSSILRWKQSLWTMFTMQNFGKLYVIMSDEKRKASSHISLKKFRYTRLGRLKCR